MKQSKLVGQDREAFIVEWRQHLEAIAMCADSEERRSKVTAAVLTMTVKSGMDYALVEEITGTQDTSQVRSLFL